jgi:Flp pilus assembly protein CpaB
VGSIVLALAGAANCGGFVRSRSNLLVLLGIAFFVVGGVLVYLITDDDGDGGSKAAEQVQVVIATTDIEAGSLANDLIEENKLRAVEIDPARLVAGAIGSLTQLEGATFTQGFGANQQITQVGVQLANNRTFTIPEGFDAVAVQLEFVPGVAAYVSPGDHINLYGAASERAELVLTNVEVLDVDLTIPPRRGSTTDSNTSATPRASTSAVTYLLALHPDDAEKVIYLTQFQALYASLTADGADPAGPTPGRDAGSVFEEEPNAAFGG